MMIRLLSRLSIPTPGVAGMQFVDMVNMNISIHLLIDFFPVSLTLCSTEVQLLVTNKEILLQGRQMIPLNWTSRVAIGHFEVLISLNAKTLNRSLNILAKVFDLINKEKLDW